MSDIFIGYAREDRDKAKTFAELFQQQDSSVWWDRNIPPGRSFDEEALGAAKCVMVLWSKNFARMIALLRQSTVPFFARAVIDATRADHSVFCISDFDQIYDEAIKPAN